MKKFSLSVSDFALPAPRRGSIDSFSGLGRGPLVGLEIHQRIQEQRKIDFPNYTSEMWISQTFERQGYTFEIGGRVDGFFSGNPCKIEEIKSSFNTQELAKRLQTSVDDHPYCLQLKTYGYFYEMNFGVKPGLELLLVSSRDEGEQMQLPLILEKPNYEEWLERRLLELVEEARLLEKLIKRRKKAAKDLQFPFENPRPGQLQLMEAVDEGLQKKQILLIQAPTGLGKTMGTLYPSLREALNRGQKVIYVTPKNSQHGVAENALSLLQEKGAKLRSLTVTAKSKMCLKSEPLCNPEYCEYAKDHYTKVAENKLPEVLAKKKNLQSRTFKKLGEEYQVCPFELQMEALSGIDTVICDYNYVFSPYSSAARLAGGLLQPKSKPNLVIDEAHNLPSRARDYFSPSLSVSALEDLKRKSENFYRPFRSELFSLLDEAILLVKNSGAGSKVACKIELHQQPLLEMDQLIKSFLSRYLTSAIEIYPGDAAMKLSFYWSEFISALEFVSFHANEFFTTFYPEPAKIKITCCDASLMIADRYDDFSQVVAFSATLKPFEYYRRMIGLKDRNVKSFEFSSPFPEEHRKLIVIPQISSKYSQREKNYPRIAETLQKVINLKKGNYIAFFPSFEFMERVHRLFVSPAGFQVLKQERFLKRNDVDQVLEKLSQPETAHMVFAVQGGVFSEGIDYPGRMLIGAFVIGSPLPVFNLENESLREYFEENYSSGFDYTYTFPAMAKSIQAAGRVIRSESDQGLIILMDDRFLHPSFVQTMPADWFKESPQELTSQSILTDVAHFWEKTESKLYF